MYLNEYSDLYQENKQEKQSKVDKTINKKYLY